MCAAKTSFRGASKVRTTTTSVSFGVVTARGAGMTRNSTSSSVFRVRFSSAASIASSAWKHSSMLAAPDATAASRSSFEAKERVSVSVVLPSFSTNSFVSTDWLLSETSVCTISRSGTISRKTPPISKDVWSGLSQTWRHLPPTRKSNSARPQRPARRAEHPLPDEFGFRMRREHEAGGRIEGANHDDVGVVRRGNRDRGGHARGLLATSLDLVRFVFGGGFRLHHFEKRIEPLVVPLPDVAELSRSRRRRRPAPSPSILRGRRWPSCAVEISPACSSTFRWREIAGWLMGRVRPAPAPRRRRRRGGRESRAASGRRGRRRCGRGAARASYQ